MSVTVICANDYPFAVVHNIDSVEASRICSALQSTHSSNQTQAYRNGPNIIQRYFHYHEVPEYNNLTEINASCKLDLQ